MGTAQAKTSSWRTILEGRRVYWDIALASSQLLKRQQAGILDADQLEEVATSYKGGRSRMEVKSAWNKLDRDTRRQLQALLALFLILCQAAHSLP